MTKRESNLNDADRAFIDWLRTHPDAWKRYALTAALAGVLAVFLSVVGLPNPPFPGWVETAFRVLACVVLALGVFLAVLTRGLVRRVDDLDDRGQQ